IDIHSATNLRPIPTVTELWLVECSTASEELVKESKSPNPFLAQTLHVNTWRERKLHVVLRRKYELRKCSSILASRSSVGIITLIKADSLAGTSRERQVRFRLDPEVS
ncbi:hypothetical protein N9B39_02060, partial [bacterium]|nr:hypothetical protein [bacterium]